MVSDLFQPALAQLKIGQFDLWGPRSFKQYRLDHSLPAVNTAQHLSVDSIERLSPSLRDAQVMVLRLGSTDGSGAQFALVSTPDRLEDFFLTDEALDFPPPVTYLPDASFRSLFPYFLFPRLTEKLIVNLAFCSGLFGYALDLDQPYPISAPPTGASTYTFTFRPHRELPDQLTHMNGQVEIDAVFTGRRNGQDCLFIMESKADQYQSLAKHKLVYPILALAPNIPKDIPVIPVYVRVSSTDKGIRYRITECTLPDPRDSLVCLNDLVPVSCKELSLPLPQMV